MNAMSDDSPKPTKAWVMPSEECLRAFVATEVGADPAAFSLERLAANSLGFFLFCKFCREVGGERAKARFLEEVARYRRAIGNSAKALKAAQILRRFLLPPSPVGLGQALEEGGAVDVYEGDLYRGNDTSLRGDELLAAYAQAWKEGGLPVSSLPPSPPARVQDEGAFSPSCEEGQGGAGQVSSVPAGAGTKAREGKPPDRNGLEQEKGHGGGGGDAGRGASVREGGARWAGGGEGDGDNALHMAGTLKEETCAAVWGRITPFLRDLGVRCGPVYPTCSTTCVISFRRTWIAGVSPAFGRAWFTTAWLDTCLRALNTFRSTLWKFYKTMICSNFSCFISCKPANMLVFAVTWTWNAS